MTKTKSTKRALLSSVMALFLCFTMLLGTTFAWFTDSVTSDNNVIKSGNLDIAVEYTLDGEAWANLDGANDLFDSLWEPGHTEVIVLKIENKGTLDLKYIANMNIVNEIKGMSKDGDEIVLSEILQVSSLIVESEGIDEMISKAFESENAIDWGTSVDLKDGTVFGTDEKLYSEEIKYIFIKVDMPESVGNEANHDGVNVPSIEFGVNVLATQLASEEDAFGKDYDENAKYPSFVDKWDGTADISWYDENATEFILTSAEALAGLNQLIGEGITFEGKTITLNSDMDMSGTEWKPTVADFAGIFDGNGHTISNLARTVNTYESGGRSGLFAHVEGGTVKNVTLDNAAFYAYGPYGAVVAGSAHGDCTFENITLTNCDNLMYNTGSAGIVGLAYSDSNYTFTGINIDDSNSIGGYWGTPDISAGGLIGYYWTYGSDNGSITVKDSYFAQEMNCYNDVVANYQYYAYRYSGMLVGYVQTTEGSSPVLEDLVCENVTVEYGEWADYYYCEMVKNTEAYGNEYQFSRLTPISGLDEIKSGETWTKTGDFVLIDGDTATCYHIIKDEETGELRQYHHSEAGTEEIDGVTVDVENNVCIKIVFNQLYGGGQGIYGATEHEGVTVIYPED